MGKKHRRRAPAAPTTTAAAPTRPAGDEEENMVVREEEMLRDQIDQELLERDEIRFDGDSDNDTDDEDLQTEEVLELPTEDEDEDEEEEEEEDELRERGFEEVEDELRVKDKAWGKKKSLYYNEEEEEEELSSAEEEELEEEEEREAMVLQKRLMSHLTAQDFDTSRYTAASTEHIEKESVVTTDFTVMSKDEKLIYLLQNSPELPEMLSEFREKLSEARDPLYPLLQLGRQKGTFSDSGHSYIEAKYKLNLLYCLNIGYYLMLHSAKDDKQDLKTHPVIERIVNIRNMYTTCAKTDCTLEQEIEHLLKVDEEKETEEEEDLEKKETKKRNLSSSDGEQAEEDLYEKYRKINEEKKKKKKKKKKGIEILPEDPTTMEDGDDKRGITYKIMKNKGLTPHRTKEQRNPRVKHRKKYEQALKKRRSQIPDYRKQEGSYGGEKSGIKSGLTKGTVLK